jgi:hypothetical protein
MHISEHYDSSNSKVEPLKDSGFMLLHYNYIGLDTRLESIKKTKNNLSKLGKEMLDHGINKQLAVSDDFLIEDFNSHYEKREEVNL